MRCGCPECGLYMIQAEQGLHSGCVCPDCGFHCTACMGTGQQPIARDSLAARAAELMAQRQLADQEETHE